MPSNKNQTHIKLYHIYWGTSGIAGDYLNQIYSVLSSSNLNIKQTLFVSSNYPYNESAHKYFFPLTDTILKSNKRPLRTYIRAIELIIAMFLITITIIKNNPTVINYSHVSLSRKVVFYFLVFWKKILKKSLIITAHDILPLINNKGEDTLRRKLFLLSDYLVVHNKHDIEVMKNYLGVRELKIVVHKFPLLGKIHKSESDISYDLLFIGSIRENKGIRVLLEAFQELRKDGIDISLAICGKLENPDMLSLLSNKNDIHLNLNFLADDMFMHYINSSRIIVLPYLFATNSGILSIAITQGKQIIASDIDLFKNSEFLDKNDLFKSGDSNSLKSVIKNKLANIDYNYSNQILLKYKIDFKASVISAYSKMLK